MPRVGIRELKARASEIVRAVREEKAQYVITYQGQPVGVLSPIDEQQLDALLVQAVRRPTDEELTAELDELSQSIARRRKGRKTAASP
jgi:prevent-host-death family protein